MYEGDQPNAERRAAALALDRELLRELLGQEELRELIDPGALETVEADLQRLSERTRADIVDALHDVLRRVGDLTLDEARAARRHAGLAGAAARRAAGDRAARRRRAALGRGRGRRACTATRSAPSRPPGCPRRSSPTCRTRWSGSCGATPAPTARSRPRALRERYGDRPHAGAGAAGAVRRPRARRAAPRRDARASGATPRCCGGCGAPRWPRCARRSSPPTSARFARFQASWQGVDRHPPSGAGIDRLREVLVPLQGLALPLEVWERDVLPRRTGAYSPAWLDQLCARGEIVWVGAGALGPPLRPRGAVLPRRRAAARPAAALRRGAVGAGPRGDPRAPAGRRRASSPTC